MDFLSDNTAEGFLEPYSLEDDKAIVIRISFRLVWSEPSDITRRDTKDGPFEPDRLALWYNGSKDEEGDEK
jgi:hypothetical protein